MGHLGRHDMDRMFMHSTPLTRTSVIGRSTASLKFYASAFDQDLGWCVDDDVDLLTFYRHRANWAVLGDAWRATRSPKSRPQSRRGSRTRRRRGDVRHISTWATGRGDGHVVVFSNKP